MSDKLVDLTGVKTDVFWNGSFNNANLIINTDVPAGNYKIRLLTQIPGDDYWVYAEHSADYPGVADSEVHKYEYEILDTGRIPFCQTLMDPNWSDEFSTYSNLFVGDNFSLSAVVENPSNKEIKGTVKLIRWYNRECFGSDEPWEECVSQNATLNGVTANNGTFEVSIAAGENKLLTFEKCQSNIVFNRDEVIHTAYISLFFKEKGSDKWMLLPSYYDEYVYSKSKAQQNYFLLETYSRPVESGYANVSVKYEPITDCMVIEGVPQGTTVSLVQNLVVFEELIGEKEGGKTITFRLLGHYGKARGECFLYFKGNINKVINIKL